MSEWWATIGQPFAEALLSLDTVKIKAAFANAPSSYYEYIHSIYVRSPEHVIIETFLIVFVVYITFVKRDKPKGTAAKLSEREIDELCEEWTPEPIIPPNAVVDFNKAKPIGIVEATPDTHIKLQGHVKPLLNLATFDFLGLGSRSELKEVAIKTLTKYGCGSCGPRGFYGTIDTHEILEKDIAQMMGTTDSITFSDTEATSSSVLPAFAKRGDLIVMDNGCNDAILVGANLARCTVLYYKHNDLEDLERVLKRVRDEDKRKKRGSDCQRRYVVTEALFRNHGDMIELPKVVELCNKYFFRLFLDESFSFGVLGKSGRGLTEHFGMDVSEVAIICSSLAGSTASVGGFSTGSQEVVDYQRINSAGYVFSASAPPFTSACCSEAIRIMKDEPELFTKLRDNAKLAHDALSRGVQGVFGISKAEVSPILHVRLLPEVVSRVGSEENQRALQRKVCDAVMQKCLAKGVAICSPRYKTHQTLEPLPSLRVSVTAIHSPKELEAACKIISTEAMATAKEVLATFPVDSTPVSGLRQRKQ
ncbi:Serine palmitoyltransferase [Phytophthora megakarya]|uniref:serine C-palmitoyltransferase n=1 Tax=Phytophthora megakarya TaxID=4795 RepID=A0A225WCQ8_9STRA|nr:Serine palmitoyltransferase [Phytophthora megakarya]